MQPDEAFDPAPTAPLCHLGAIELAARVRAGSLRVADVVAAHLDAIARVDPAINAVCTLDAERALRAASSADDALRSGRAARALEGVPVLIKDVTETEGLRTTWGSPLYADHVPSADAEVVRRLRAAGAIVLGKSNVPEFAAGAHTSNRLFGTTLNPHDVRRSAGGSTGGGAAAVAARLAPLAEGTDHGGSLRVPAAFCGVVGLRPTPGLVPSHPSVQPWDLQRVHGPIARDAADAALMLDAMAGPLAASPVSVPRPWPDALAAMRAERVDGLRLAWVPNLGGPGIDDAVAAVCTDALAALAATGPRVRTESIALPGAVQAYLTLRGAWMVAQYDALADRLDELPAALADNIRAGRATGATDLAQAERARAAAWNAFGALFEQCDLIATPTVAVAPFDAARSTPASVAGRSLAGYVDWLAQTFLVTLVGLPAVSVPAGLDADGLPVGLQLIGPRWSEPRLLACAAALQRLRPVPMPMQHA